MQAILIRHGRTPGNDERRYIGRTDESLSEKGRAEAEQAQKNFDLKFVYVSPLIRARETAAILFPNAEQVVLPGLRETDFGIFEGKNADEMVDDAEYRAWVDSMCEAPCPGGETKADFSRRSVAAFFEAIRLADGDAVFVVHGGTVMSVFSALAEPKEDYYFYSVPNLCGWEAECLSECGRLVLKDAIRLKNKKTE